MTSYYQQQQKAMQDMETIAKKVMQEQSTLDVEMLAFEMLRKHAVSPKFVEKYMSLLERKYEGLEEYTEWPL